LTETITKSITVDAPPSKVFQAITDEKELTNWFPSIARLDARVGGSVEFQFQRADGTVDHIVLGKVIEIIPDKKFSMSWKNTSDPNFPDTVVTWMLEPDGGKTKVKLVHSGFEKGKWLDLHDGGWSYFAGRLVEYCQTGRVEDRQMFKELGEEIRKTIVIDATPDVVFKALTDEQELTQWFPNQAVLEARVDGAMEFRFERPDGERHTIQGRVIEIIPNKKLSYSWNMVGGSDPDSLVIWTLEPVDGGKTQVTLVHSGLRPAPKGEEWSYEKGWTYFIGRLVERYKK
jgi:uncharacterized protein YndB with AHSA1/START domain